MRVGQQDVLVELFVIEVIELHDASHEGVLRIRRLLIARAVLVLAQRNHHRLLDEVCRVHHCVRVQLPELRDLVDSFLLEVPGSQCSEIWVSGALLDYVPEFFAARAAHELEHFFVFFLVLVCILKIVFVLVL